MRSQRLLLVIALTSLASLLPGAEPGGWEQVPRILGRVVPPRFPDRQFDVNQYGAKADGTTDCLKAFRAAIEAASAAGGGRVLAPAGTYLVNGPIHLKSNIELHLAKDATILFGSNPDDYLVGEASKAGCVCVRWEGSRCYNYSPLVYAYQQENIAITGQGTLDGQTQKSWASWKKKQGPDQAALRQMGIQLVPVEQRVFGKGHFLRPSLIGPYDCKNVLIEGITVRNSPLWTIHLVLSSNVTVRGVRVGPGTTNDDGCNPESCSDVLVEHCTFDTRDDNIAIKAGRNNDGWAVNGGRPSQNIIIRHCTFTRGSPGGISIGSEMSGDVRNVFIENNVMKRVGYVLYLKSNPERGGIVENIFARKNTIDTCDTLLRCETDYKRVRSGSFPPLFRNVFVEQTTCQNVLKTVLDCSGIAGHPIRGICLSDVSVTKAGQPKRLEHVEDVHLRNVTVNGQRVGEK